MNADKFNPDGLVIADADPKAYADVMNGEVLPYLNRREQRTTVEGAGGRPIVCYRYDAKQPRGTVFVLHGFTENALKFSELSYSLLQNHYSVLTCDQRGHGASWRAPEIDDTSLTHVDDFNEYIEDLAIICLRLLNDMPRLHYIFAHSMGGAVASLFLERHPDVFQKAVLCAPMIAPNRGGVPYLGAKLICGGAALAGRRDKRTFTTRPYAGPEDFDTSCATSRARFDWYDAVKQAHPEYQNNGPSYGWTREALNVSRKLLWPGAAEKINCPVRLYTAQSDNQVLPQAQEMFIRRVKQGERILVRGAKHEIYRSNDDVFFPWWREILEYFGAEG